MKKLLFLLSFWLILILAVGCNEISPQEGTSTIQLPSPTSLPTSTPTILPSPSPTPTLLPPTPVKYPEEDPIWENEADYTICQTGCSFNTIQSALDHIDGEELVILELPEGIHTEAGIVITQCDPGAYELQP